VLTLYILKIDSLVLLFHQKSYHINIKYIHMNLTILLHCVENHICQPSLSDGQKQHFVRKHFMQIRFIAVHSIDRSTHEYIIRIEDKATDTNKDQDFDYYY